MGNKTFKPLLSKNLFRGIFIASFIFAIISAIQIVTADSQIENSLQEWELMKESMSLSVQDDEDRDSFPTLVAGNGTTSLIGLENLGTNSTQNVHAENNNGGVGYGIRVKKENVETGQMENMMQIKQTEQVEKMEAMKDVKEGNSAAVMIEHVDGKDAEHASQSGIASKNTKENIVFSTELEPGKVIGKMMIPTIDKELPIVHGTESKHLKKGVGHYIGTALPGEHQHSVLAGHRDTVFRGLEKMQIGDRFEVETLAGLFTYEVEQLEIVDSDDRTVIVPRDEPILTLITCYPFYYVGNAPQRYIVTGKLVE